jgi:hypothetical protein
VEVGAQPVTGAGAIRRHGLRVGALPCRVLLRELLGLAEFRADPPPTCYPSCTLRWAAAKGVAVIVVLGEKRTMKTENIIRVVRTILFAAVAAFAISVAVGGHWWETPAPPSPPPPTTDVAGVADQVVTLARGQMATNDRTKDLGITLGDDLQLINIDLNQYRGLITATTRKGTQKFLQVDVVADPTGAMFYNMDGISLTNLVDAANAEEPNLLMLRRTSGFSAPNYRRCACKPHAWHCGRQPGGHGSLPGDPGGHSGAYRRSRATSAENEQVEAVPASREPVSDWML